MERNKQVDIIATLEGIARATNHSTDELKMEWDHYNLIISVYYIYYEEDQEWEDLIAEIDLKL